MFYCFYLKNVMFEKQTMSRPSLSPQRQQVVFQREAKSSPVQVQQAYVQGNRNVQVVQQNQQLVNQRKEVIHRGPQHQSPQKQIVIQNQEIRQSVQRQVVSQQSPQRNESAKAPQNASFGVQPVGRIQMKSVEVQGRPEMIQVQSSNVIQEIKSRPELVQQHRNVVNQLLKFWH